MDKYEDVTLRLKRSTIERLEGIAEENGFLEGHTLSEIIEAVVEEL